MLTLKFDSGIGDPPDGAKKSAVTVILQNPDNLVIISSLQEPSGLTGWCPREVQHLSL